MLVYQPCFSKQMLNVVYKFNMDFKDQLQSTSKKKHGVNLQLCRYIFLRCVF